MEGGAVVFVMGGEDKALGGEDKALGDCRSFGAAWATARMDRRATEKSKEPQCQTIFILKEDRYQQYHFDG